MFQTMSDHLRLFILIAAAWTNRDQQKIIVYLLEEIRVYRKHFSCRRLRFTDAQRRRLGAKAKGLGRKGLDQFAPNRHAGLSFCGGSGTLSPRNTMDLPGEAPSPIGTTKDAR